MNRLASPARSFSASLLLACSAALLVVALPQAASAAAAPEALALVPPDSVSVGVVRLVDLRKSPLADGLFRDLDKTTVDGDAARFLEETGLRPSEDVDSVLFALTPASVEGGESSGFIAFEGRFDPTRLAGAVALRGGTRRAGAGGELWILSKKAGETGKDAAVAFPDRHLVLAGTVASVEKALAARSAGGTTFRSGGGLGAKLSRVDTGASAWVLVDMARFPKVRAAHSGVSVEGEGNGRPFATLIGSMRGVTFFAGAATVSGDSLKLSATGFSPDGTTRDDLEDGLRGILAVWRIAVQDSKPELVPVLRKFRVEKDSAGVTVSGTLPAEAMKALSERKAKKTEK